MQLNHSSLRPTILGEHEEDERRLLPDTGAKDGLCDECWAIHVGRWAHRRGHKPLVDMLPERKVVSGVGSGSQTVEERVATPVGLEDVRGNKYLSTYRDVAVRNSSFPALLGINSLEK